MSNSWNHLSITSCFRRWRKLLGRDISDQILTNKEKLVENLEMEGNLIEKYLEIIEFSTLRKGRSDSSRIRVIAMEKQTSTTLGSGR